MKQRKPVSRVDSNNTHGWLARVYRAEWVGPKSFADRQYGGREMAEAAAWTWVKIADERLPRIPPKPVLMKATVHLRRDEVKHLEYFDVYMGTGRKDVEQWSTKFYFRSPNQPKIFRSLGGVEKIDLVTDDKAVAKQKADDLAKEINAKLQVEYRAALIAWYVEHDRLLEQILSMWNEVKQESPS